MRIPLTKYGWPQVAVYPIVAAAAMIAVAVVSPSVAWGPAVVLAEIVLSIVLVWSLAFFRDPRREAPSDDALLVAPADGKVTDVETVDESEFIGGPALRIGIFLSIFNVHINRAPCQARVEAITYRKGRYLNAMSPLSGKVNESNALAMVRANEPKDRLIVRQISGAIARRIVCVARQGQELARGEEFGMIKFGSRTELYVPMSENMECLVQISDKVRAGVTPLVRYGRCHD
jgi:phosphatidylserine decarboxylase